MSSLIYEAANLFRKGFFSKPSALQQTDAEDN